MNGPEPYWQSWTFDPEGDFLTATSHAPAGSTSGDTTSTYHYGVSGHGHAVSSISAANSVTGSLPSVSYGYDGAGDTTVVGGQTLTWDPNRNLATAGTAAAPVNYIYTADSVELMESDTTGGTTTTTLYLPGEQLSANGTTTTGVRYYSFAGHVIGETTPSTLYWLSGSVQGTLTTAVAAFSESSPPIRRATTPYGTPLSGAGSWPDDRGFLGDPAHTATGLSDIGARKYDPATGLFLSVDPVLATTSPQTMTGYTYAAGNPSTDSDPTGLGRIPPPGYCPSSAPGCPGYRPPAPAGGWLPCTPNCAPGVVSPPSPPGLPSDPGTGPGSPSPGSGVGPSCLFICGYKPNTHPAPLITQTERDLLGASGTSYSSVGRKVGEVCLSFMLLYCQEPPGDRPTGRTTPDDVDITLVIGGEDEPGEGGETPGEGGDPFTAPTPLLPGSDIGWPLWWG